MRSSTLLWSTALYLCTPLAAQSEAAPDKKQQKSLVEEYRGLDARTEDGFARKMEIIEDLDRVPLEGTKDLKSWRKTFTKFDKKHGRRLETKGGRHYFWEEGRQGLYIVGGKTKNPKGLLIGMHGGGVGSGDANNSAAAMSSAASTLGWVAIFPEVLEKTERGWTDSGTEEWVMDLVDAGLRTWDVDPNHVYFAGHSMGGYGSWTLGGHHSDRVAALAPSAGAPTPVLRGDGSIASIDRGVVPNLRNIPMVVYQSTDDPQVPPDVNQAAVKDVGRAKERYGGYEDFTYWEVSGRGHALPEGGMIKLLEKIAGFERQPIQDKLVWQPTLDWKRQYAWLWWPEPRMNRVIVVTRDADSNTIAFETRANLETMQVLLDERVVDMEREVIITVNGKQTNRGLPAPSLGTLILTSDNPDTELQFVARMKVYGED